MKVLFVEDDKKIVSFVKKGLKEQGLVVDTCEDGEEVSIKSRLGN